MKIKRSLLSLSLLFVACDTDVSPVEEIEPAPVQQDLCVAAEDYLTACGGEGGSSFLQICTPELAADLLERDCGELEAALENAGIISADPVPPMGNSWTTGEAGAPGFGGWLTCKLGFKFACPTPACMMPVGADLPDEGDSCLDWLDYEGCGECFYYNCREEQAQCGADGYLLGYVGRYCRRFTSVTQSSLSPAGQAWMDSVRECLVQTLDAETGPDSTCEEIEEVGIASHAACYVQAGFCELSITDWFAIVHTIDPGDIPLKQILSTGHMCLQDWFNFQGD